MVLEVYTLCMRNGDAVDSLREMTGLRNLVLVNIASGCNLLQVGLPTSLGCPPSNRVSHVVVLNACIVPLHRMNMARS